MILPPGVVAVVIGLLQFSLAPTAAGKTLAAGLVVAVIIDGAWAVVANRRFDLQAQSPSLSMLGEPCTVELRAAGAPLDALVRMLSAPSAPWWTRLGPSRTVLSGTPAQVGVYAGVLLEVMVSGPLGLAGCVRRFWVPLVTPLSVAPPPTAPDPGVVAELLRAAADGTGMETLPRGVRTFQPGDPVRHVHWPSTARAGQVMVRDFDRAVLSCMLVLDLGLSTDLAAITGAMARLIGTADAALAAGAEVQVTSRQNTHGSASAWRPAPYARRPKQPVPDVAPPTAVVVANVSSRNEVMHAVTLAEHGPVPAPPGGYVFSPDGDHWA